MRLHPTTIAQRGSVLVVVLWASVGLVSIALLFGHSMLMAYRGVDNEFAGRQADAAIDGAIRYVESLLTNAQTPGMFPDPTTYEAEAVAVGDATFWLIGRPEDPANTTTREYGLVDEAAKLNLNEIAVTTRPSHFNPTALTNWSAMTPDLVAQLTDWCNASGTGTGGGGITATTVKHAPFESVEELALVSGMTRDLLYGGDANLNGIPDSDETTGASASQLSIQAEPSLFDSFTVFTREPNTRSDTGDARIDLTKPAAPEMKTLLEEKFDPNAVTQILARFPPGTTPTSALDFYIQSQMSDTDFGQIIDFLTTEPAATPFIEGRVNVNTASEVVLSCVPGLNAQLASQIVSARLSNPPIDTNIAWIVPVIGNAAAIAAGPHLTGQSFQVSADIAAVGRHGRGYRRIRVVIDTSDSTTGPQIIYRRDLSPLGWALGSEVRQQLALKKEVR